MIVLCQTPVFTNWIRDLQDRRAQKTIAGRSVRVEAGNLGDTKPLPGGTRELRIHQESGYRLCFARRGKAVILLPFVGGKGSQEQYNHVAQRLAKEIDDENYEV